jgi:succinate dehydrogenase / fumarate reductase, cytochrome b subunit
MRMVTPPSATTGSTAATDFRRTVRGRSARVDRPAWKSTVALKLIMALSGILFILFVLGHMYGNLKAFNGHDSYNEYAEHLRTLGEPILPRSGLLWLMRAGLLVALVGHVTCATILWRRALRARTTGYVARTVKHSSLASRTMRWGGVTILLFLVWHLINFTIGKVNVRGGPTNDPYNLLIDTFSVWWSTALYLTAMIALGLHLWHGTWSAAQTLGWTSSAPSRRLAKVVAGATAVLIAGGFSLSPIFILAGVIES